MQPFNKIVIQKFKSFICQSRRDLQKQKYFDKMKYLIHKRENIKIIWQNTSDKWTTIYKFKLKTFKFQNLVNSLRLNVL